MSDRKNKLSQAESGKTYTVGELAKIAGISVRTLQYYDRYGLLTCNHSEGGRRLYCRSDLVRLQQILFFKSYGFSLSEIRDRLIDVHSGIELANLLKTQRDVIESQIASLKKTTSNLNKIITEVRNLDEVNVDTFVAAVELTKLNDPYTFLFNYLNDHQVKDFISRFSDDKTVILQQKRADRLFSELLRLYKSGADPLCVESQNLADSFWQMAVDFSGNDPETIKSFISMGIDTKNWPDDVKYIGNAVGEFLSVAMFEYLKKHNIPLDSFADLL